MSRFMKHLTPKIPMTSNSLKSFALLAGALVLAACATGTSNNATTANTSAPATDKYVPLDESRAGLPTSSPECVAQKLKSGEPFPASAIPEGALSKKQSGWVAMRYDVIAGAAQNIKVVTSRPAGLYDTAALQHAAKYKDPTGSTVRGCVMTIEVKF
jgi:hypothetical protein